MTTIVAASEWRRTTALVFTCVLMLGLGAIGCDSPSRAVGDGAAGTRGDGAAGTTGAAGAGGKDGAAGADAMPADVASTGGAGSAAGTGGLGGHGGGGASGAAGQTAGAGGTSVIDGGPGDARDATPESGADVGGAGASGADGGGAGQGDASGAAGDASGAAGADAGAIGADGAAGAAGTDAGAADVGGDAGADAGAPDVGGDAGADAGAPDVGGAAGAGGGDGGSDAVPTGPRACATTAGANLAPGLTVRRPELGTRRIAAAPASTLVRIARDPLTGALIVMSTGGRFWKVDPVANTVTDAEVSYAFGGDHRGMAFGPDGTLYTLAISATGDLSFTLRRGVPGAQGRTWTTVATSAGYARSSTAYDLGFNALTVSPDGQWLFVGAGARTDHGELRAGAREVALSSAVLKIPASGTDLALANDQAALTSDGTLYADGLRNAFDLAFNAAGDLLAAESGADIDLPDEVDFIQPGKHYGFPWRLGAEANPVLDPTYTPTGDLRLHTGYQSVDTPSYLYDVGFPTAPVGVTFVDPIPNLGPDADKFRVGKTGTVRDASSEGFALTGITAHRTPLGLAFDTVGTLCGDYYKAGFVLSYGAQVDSMGDRGEDLLLLQLTKAGGAYLMKATQLVSGIKTPIDSVLVDNKLFTISFGAGTSIYEIALPVAATP